MGLVESGWLVPMSPGPAPFGMQSESVACIHYLKTLWKSPPARSMVRPRRYRTAS